MPELPEVEVTARALQQAITGWSLRSVWVSGKKLRHPFPRGAIDQLRGVPLMGIGRRAKYVLMEFPSGYLAVHLGMSGSVLCAHGKAPPAKLHDHVVMEFESPSSEVRTMIYHDPRRFGSFQWCDRQALHGTEIGAVLGAGAAGIEPLGQSFNGAWLFEHSRGRRTPIKQWLMDGSVVVGVGNIYACEALFDAGIHPSRKAGSISRPRYERLAVDIKKILLQAIEGGGSTIQNFQGPDGTAGRYGQLHRVYGRSGQPCPRCGRAIRRSIMGQRSTFFCHGCQR